MRRRVRSEGLHLARTLEGNKAHGRRGRRSTGNGRQSLRTRWRSKAPRSRSAEVRLSRTAQRPSANDEGATATVMWTSCSNAASCQRGDFFEGCEMRRGKAYGSAGGCGSSSLGMASRNKQRPGERNAANPFRYQDATSLEPGARSKPSRWRETTRTERDSGGMVPVGPKSAATSMGVGAHQSCRMRGTLRANPMRGEERGCGQPHRALPGAEWRSEDWAKITRDPYDDSHELIEGPRKGRP